MPGEPAIQALVRQVGSEIVPDASFSSGTHTLRFDCMGKSPSSAGYLLGFEALSALVPVYSCAADVDLRTLQKKN
jgi:hypothetical protein